MQTLIEDLRTINWDAADILWNSWHLITDPKYKREFLKSKDNYDPVTNADLDVNKIILKNKWRIQECKLVIKVKKISSWILSQK